VTFDEQIIEHSPIQSDAELHNSDEDDQMQLDEQPSQQSDAMNMEEWDYEDDDFDNFVELLQQRRATRVSTGDQSLDEVLDEFSALLDTLDDDTVETGETSESEQPDTNGTDRFGRFITCRICTNTQSCRERHYH
jgi:hypothetical protein